MTGPRFVFFLCLGVAVTGELKENFLGDSFEFIETKHCRQHEAKLEHLWTSDRSRLVARFDGEFWKPGPGYEGRMSPNTSAVLHSTNINDNGLYALTCGEDETRTQLDILVASERSATEGESAQLTFHHITTGAQRYIRCERNGKLMFELDIESEKIGKVTEPEGRVSVSPDWRLTGNVSVFFSWVKTEDQGDYILYGLHEKESKRTWGHPAAVRMKVNKKHQNQTTFTPAPTQRDTELKTGTWTTVVIATAVTLIVAFSAAGVGFGFGWWLKSRSSKRSPGPPTHAPDDGMQFIPGRLATNVNGDPTAETAV